MRVHLILEKRRCATLDRNKMAMGTVCPVAVRLCTTRVAVHHCWLEAKDPAPTSRPNQDADRINVRSAGPALGGRVSGIHVEASHGYLTQGCRDISSPASPTTPTASNRTPIAHKSTIDGVQRYPRGNRGGRCAESNAAAVWICSRRDGAIWI